MASRRPPRPTDPPASGPSHGNRPPDRPTLRRYNVILLKAADPGLMAVVRAVMDLTRFGEAEATHRMWEWHHRGKALILATHLERAELYVEQFADRGLTAGLEPV